jgi:hypothetical protein
MVVKGKPETMNADNFIDENRLLIDLENRDIRAFIRLYKENRDDLVIFAFSQLNDHRKVSEAVDELFEDLWVSARFTAITPPIYKYLIEKMRVICDRRKGLPRAV